MAPPVKVLAPLSTTVPDPATSKASAPETTLARTRFSPEAVFKVRVSAAEDDIDVVRVGGVADGNGLI